MPYVRILLLVAVAFAFYTLGAKAGRGRYRAIAKGARNVWSSPTVKSARRTARKGARRGTRRVARAAH